MNHIIIFSIIGFVSALLQMAIVTNIADIQCTIKRLLFTTIIIYVPHSIVFNFIAQDNGFLQISIISWLPLIMFAYRISFKQSWQKSAFIAIGQYVVLIAGTDYISFFFVNLLPEYIRLLIWDNIYIPRIIVAVVFIPILAYTKKLADRGSALNHLITKYWPFYLVFFIVFAAYDVIHMIEWVEVQYTYNVAEAFAVALFLILFLHSLLYVRKDQRLKITEREVEIQQLYADSQNKIIRDLRVAQHDFNGMFNIMHEMANSGEYTKLNALIDKITKPIPDTIELPEVLRKYPMLRGVLAEKMVRAQIKGVALDIELMDKNIDLKYCSDIDYNCITGIFLDNGIEAAASSPQQSVKFKIYVKGETFITEVINSCDSGYEVDIKRIFDSGYTTKKDHLGEGLYKIRLYQDKYKLLGYAITIHISFENGYFMQVLAI